MNLTFLKNITIHSDWNGFLTEENKQLLQRIETAIGGGEFTPPANCVLRFMEMPLSAIKVVILGQDPYPQPGVATGRAFEVGTLQSWNDPFKNISLKNILRTLYKAYFGEALKYSEIKTRFDNEFPVLQPQQLFKHWEKQGVLLLNTSFTVEPGNPGSHKHYWEVFTQKLLHFINEQQSEITWFLWGNHAKEATKGIEIKNTIVSQHPMMCYDKPGRDTDFLFGKINCFSAFIPEIDWTGYNLKPGKPNASTLF